MSDPTETVRRELVAEIIGVVLLMLSVFHCTEGIAVLTGSKWLLAAELAVGIDCGLVACEVVSVIED